MLQHVLQVELLADFSLRFDLVILGVFADDDRVFEAELSFVLILQVLLNFQRA